VYKGATVGVIVPAYNEAKLIGRVVETMPDYIDKIIVVDDASRDSTCEVVRSYKSSLGDRLILIEHEKNQGVGGAIASGYKWARDNKLEISVVMAGDAQMDPGDLPKLLDPVLNGEADYTKGNRLFSGEAWKIIPKLRYFGNAILSLLTKIASGYWHVADSQSGYTATTLEVLKTLDLDGIHKRYGVPNDLLVKLNVYGFRVKDVPITPIYGIGEESGIRINRVVFTLSFLLLKLFFWRMREKYIIRDFHPLIFFYSLGLTLFPAGLLLGLYLFSHRLFLGPVSATSALFATFLFVSGLQSLFFAMWFDMEYSRNNLRR
jgi:glycosyltransferase involved in cell wall biosynthesis